MRYCQKSFSYSSSRTAHFFVLNWVPPWSLTYFRSFYSNRCWLRASMLFFKKNTQTIQLTHLAAKKRELSQTQLVKDKYTWAIIFTWLQDATEVNVLMSLCMFIPMWRRNQMRLPILMTNVNLFVLIWRVSLKTWQNSKIHHSNNETLYYHNEKIKSRGTMSGGVSLKRYSKIIFRLLSIISHFKWQFKICNNLLKVV